MTPADEPFISATLEPIPGTAAQECSRDLLKEALGHARTLIHPPSGDSTEVAAERMRQTAARSPWWRWLRRGLIVLTVGTALYPGVLSSDAVLAANAARRAPTFMPGYGPYTTEFGLWQVLRTGSPGTLDSYLGDRVSPENRLLLFGDRGAINGTRWLSLWQAHPDDPVLYCRHVVHLVQNGQDLPADFIETGEQIDPGNGWYRYFAAIDWWRRTGNALANKGRPDLDRAIGTTLGGLRAAMAMPRFDSHRDAFLSRQIAAMPPARDYPEIALQRAIIGENAGLLLDSGIDSLTEIARASSHLSSSKEGVPGLFETLCRKLILDSKTVGHQMALGFGSRKLEATLREIATIEPTAEAANRFTRQSKQLQPPMAGKRPLLYSQAQWSFAQPVTVTDRSLLATPEETLPSALAARAMVERLALRFGLLTLLIAFTGCTLAHLRWRKVAGPLAARVTSLLRPVDHAVIAAVSCGLPLILFQFVVRGGDRSILYRPGGWAGATIQGCQLAAFALAVSILVLVIETIRWRLGRRGAVLGVVIRGFNPGWCFAAVALASFAAAWLDLSALPPRLRRIDAALWSMPVLALAWPFLQFWFARGPKPERRLHRCALTRAMMPHLAAGCAIFTTLILLARSEDRRWTALDTFEKARPEHAGNVTNEQERTALATQRQLLEVLDLK
ncbi:hypothetical protein [Luteolibacter sp. LG18]|uniref:hypothetical protein n=1 Tax=Luteolibacter sp. LG18 TaxID=2819286 RepID=UPI002B2CCB8F|nr:hypothetical protein llg_14940 [Luteolibacter sp. LG18]